jgi:membrane peptidoglycan carboxypeptidase
VIVAVSALSGVLIAGLALPWVGLVNQAAKKSADAVEDFPLELRFPPLNERTKVVASDGTRIATFYDKNRKYVTLAEIDDVMQRAILAIEDSRFYVHGAIDLKGTLRAFIANEVHGDVVQGGSTITQQLVKLTRIENATSAEEVAAAQDDTKARKIEELRYAVWVEEHLSKDEILERYLNTAYFGDGAYGIQAAARHYFSTSAANLTLPQAATLAGLVQSPSTYDPTNHPAAAKARRNVVISRMLDLHVITTRQAKKASQSKLDLDVGTIPNGCVDSQAAFFCQYVLRYLLASPALGDTVEERKHLIYGGGLTIKTSVDLRYQREAQKSVEAHVFPKEKAVGALAFVEPGTGYVKAIAQSRQMGTNKEKGETFLNYSVPYRFGDSRGFQPGSTFKVFVLADAIRKGVRLDTEIYAPPTVSIPNSDYKVCDGEYLRSVDTWSPSNSTDSGTHDLYSGTQESVNTFFAKLELRTGLCGPWQLAESMGVELEDPDRNMVPPFTLGVVDASPLEMAEAYATFAARGIHCASSPILEIRNRNDDLMPFPEPECQRVLRPAYADAVNDILRGVIAPGGFADEQQLGQPAAGKTGTVQETKGVWFVGYTPNLAGASMIAGVNDAGNAITLLGETVGGVPLSDASGSGTAAPMWGDAMKPIAQWLPDQNFVPPSKAVVEGQPVEFPSFWGEDPGYVARQLSKLGLNPVISSSTYSEAPFGTVAYTSPSYNATSGDTVLIYTSLGFVPAPAPNPGNNGGGGGNNGGGGGNGGGNNGGGGNGGGGGGNGGGNGGGGNGGGGN